MTNGSLQSYKHMSLVLKDEVWQYSTSENDIFLTHLQPHYSGGSIKSCFHNSKASVARQVASLKLLRMKGREKRESSRSLCLTILKWISTIVPLKVTCRMFKLRHVILDLLLSEFRMSECMCWHVKASER
jgi:hypothetical protein